MKPPDGPRRFRWDLAMTVVAAVGILGLIVPLALQGTFAGGDPDRALTNGLRVWLAFTSIAAVIAVAVRIWRGALSARRRDALADLEELPTLLGVSLAALTMGIAVALVAPGEDPLWLMALAIASWLVISATAARTFFFRPSNRDEVMRRQQELLERSRRARLDDANDDRRSDGGA